MTTHAVSQVRAPGWLLWLGFVVLCNATGFASALVGGDAGFYRELALPSWAPPPQVFGPVWTLLYTLMGTATYLVWRGCEGSARRTAMIVFGVQLAINAAWTPVFFGLHAIGLAFGVILVVLASVIAMIVVYARRVPVAGALVVPLGLWVAFATALNGAIWRLNPG